MSFRRHTRSRGIRGKNRRQGERKPAGGKVRQASSGAGRSGGGKERQLAPACVATRSGICAAKGASSPACPGTGLQNRPARSFHAPLSPAVRRARTLRRLRQSRRSGWPGRATAAVAGAEMFAGPAITLSSAARLLKFIDVSSLQTTIWFIAEVGLE